MTMPEIIFKVCNLAVLPGWAVLILAPHWKAGRRIMATCFIPLGLAAVYLVMAALYFPGSEGDISSIKGIQTAFQNDNILVLGWVHYLCFDLFIGSWIARDARRLSLPHLAVAPCLFFTLMLGPVGLLGYWIVRAAMRKRFTADETA